MSYCEFCRRPDINPLHLEYHNHSYGYPIHDDNELFGRLILEMNQAGLSWELMLKKQTAFREAFANYDITAIAEFKDTHIHRLMNNAGIIRNRKKIEAVVYNATKIVELRSKFHTFEGWLDRHLGLSEKEWTQLFRSEFRFTGGEIVKEFLLSTSYLKGAHDENCPVFAVVLQRNPKWLRV